jgi:outer membrane cobalamin receptor
MKKLIILFVSILILSVSLLQAQPDTEDDEKKKKKDTPVHLEEAAPVIIRAKKERNESVTVLKEDDIQKSTKNDLVGVISQNVPSFHTGSNRVMGYGIASSNPAKMSIRGIGVSTWGPTTGFPIFVDGFDTGAPLFSHPMPDVLSMRNVEFIEVYRSPQPVLFGSGAMAGAVNIITKRQKREGFYTHLSGSYGTYNSTDNHLHHRGKWGIFDYSVGYNYKRTDGHRTETINGVTYTSAFWSHNGTLHLGAELGDHFYASFNSYITRYNMHDPGPDNQATAASNLEIFNITRGGLSFSIHNEFEIMEGFAQVYYNKGHHDIDDPTTGSLSFQSNDDIVSCKVQESFKFFEGNTITAGYEFKRYGGDITEPSESMGKEYLVDNSAYALAEQKLFDLITITGGGRYTNNNEYGDFGAWQAGIAVTPFSGNKLFSNIARGFTIPGIRYRFNRTGPPGLVVDLVNNLEPEMTLLYEFGAEQTLFDDLTFGVTAYNAIVDNKIVLVFGPTKYWDNSDTTLNYWGTEAFIRYEYEETAGIRFSYSFIDHEYREDGQKQILSFVPKHKFNFRLFVSLYGVYVGLNGEYVHTIYQDYEEFGDDIRLSNYLHLDMRIAYTFLEHYEVFCNLNNLTDNEYTTFVRDGGDYTVPGFNVMAGASITF